MQGRVPVIILVTGGAAKPNAGGAAPSATPASTTPSTTKADSTTTTTHTTSASTAITITLGVEPQGRAATTPIPARTQVPVVLEVLAGASQGQQVFLNCMLRLTQVKDKVCREVVLLRRSHRSTTARGGGGLRYVSETKTTVPDAPLAGGALSIQSMMTNPSNASALHTCK
jgi:hypothetical protein